MDERKKQTNNNSLELILCTETCVRVLTKAVHEDTDMQRKMKTLYFRTTVNRRTLVGRAGRTYDDRVCAAAAFAACVAVVTRHPLKSPVPSSYMDPSSTKPEVVVVVVVCANGKAVPAVVMMNC